jgi:hypothetical protein
MMNLAIAHLKSGAPDRQLAAPVIMRAFNKTRPATIGRKNDARLADA